MALALVVTAFVWLYACSTAFVADFLMTGLEEVYRPKVLSVMPNADAIVVLGGGTRGDAHYSTMGDLNQSADRLTHAVQLYKAGKAPIVLLSGGSSPGHRPEAEIMREHLELMGVNRRAILMERQSRNTHDNAVFSAIVLQGKDVDSILLVTSAFHMRRAVPLFERQGFQVIPAPTDFQRIVGDPVVPSLLPSADDLVRTSHAIKEYVGYWVYRYRGWL